MFHNIGLIFLYMQSSHTLFISQVEAQLATVPEKLINMAIMPCYIIYKTSWRKYDYVYCPSDNIHNTIAQLGVDTDINCIVYTISEALKKINALNAPATLKRACGSSKPKKIIYSPDEIWEG